MKRILSILISLGVLALLYATIDLNGLWLSLRGSHMGWLTAAVLMFGPTYFFITFRFLRLTPPQVHLTAGPALRLVLVGATMNMVLPSKMGDVAKAYFMRDRGNLGLSNALAIVMFEKAADMIALLLWCFVGMFVYRPEGWSGPLLFAVIAGMLGFGVAMLVSVRFSALWFRLASAMTPTRFKPKVQQLEDAWNRTQAYAWRDRRMSLTIIFVSILLWFLHLLQIWFFVRMLNADVPLMTHLAIMPLAILAGLLPLTFAGVGTRDAAIIATYLPFMPAATGAALGILCTSRYIVPAIIGLPMLGDMMTRSKPDKATNNDSDGEQRDSLSDGVPQ